jgi:hypothetical protein
MNYFTTIGEKSDGFCYHGMGIFYLCNCFFVDIIYTKERIEAYLAVSTKGRMWY